MAALRAAAGLALCGAAAACVHHNTCTEEGVCCDSKGKAHDLSDLRGDHIVAGPMDGPGVQYVFNLLQNVQNVPAVCQKDEDFSSNAFRYDDETHVREDSCRPLGCDLNPEHGVPGFGLLLTSSEGKLEFKYRDPSTPDFTATLTCVDDAEKNGIGAPGALEQADDESWTLSWETAYVCPDLCTGAPAANAESCQPSCGSSIWRAMRLFLRSIKFLPGGFGSTNTECPSKGYTGRRLGGTGPDISRDGGG